MPEIYKSIGTILGTTAATTIYSGVTGTAIINSVYFSNIGTGSVAVTLEILKGTTAYTLINSASIPVYSTFQPIDSPIVLESNNTLRATASATNSTHAFISILEVT